MIQLDNLSDDQTNPDPPPVRGLTFTDDLPSDVFLASPANARTDCTGAVVTAPDGGARIEFSGGQLPVDGSCQLSVDVTSAVVGTHTNSIFELTWEGGGTEFNASADLTVSEALPGFRKTFAPGSIPLGGTSQLTLTVDNTANPEGLGSFSFTDNLPAGMVVATPSNAATDCGNPQFPPTLTAVSGTGLVSLFANGFLPSFPALPAGASCTVTVDVTTNATGAFENITGELLIPPSGSAGFASALLEVPREYLVKSFVDDPVPPGGTVTLEFTVTNLSRDGTATDIAFNDDLEVVLAGLAPDGPLPTLPCGTGSALDFTAGVLSLDAGTLAPGASCSFGVPLLVPAGAAAGGFTNTTDPLTALIDGTPVVANTATDILRVQAVPILTKEFLGDPVGAGGTVTLEFTVTNTNPDLSLDEIAFVDELTSFLPFPVSVTLPAAGFCGPSSSMALVSLGTDRQGLQMTEGSLAAAGSAGDSCTFSVTIDIPAGMPAGIYTNTTGDISGEIDTCDDGCLEPISGLPASDDLEVVAAPRLTKAFTDDPALPGATVTLEFTLSHDEFAPGDATAITFTDDLAAVLPGLTATGLPMTDLCGPGNGSLDGTAMDTALNFSATTLAPGETCSFSVTLQVPDPAAAGSYRTLPLAWSPRYSE